MFCVLATVDDGMKSKGSHGELVDIMCTITFTLPLKIKKKLAMILLQSNDLLIPRNRIKPLFPQKSFPPSLMRCMLSPDLSALIYPTKFDTFTVISNATDLRAVVIKSS